MYDKILDLLEQEDVDETLLDDFVIDALLAEAADINNRGHKAQLSFLVAKEIMTLEDIHSHLVDND